MRTKSSCWTDNWTPQRTGQKRSGRRPKKEMTELKNIELRVKSPEKIKKINISRLDTWGFQVPLPLWLIDA